MIENKRTKAMRIVVTAVYLVLGFSMLLPLIWMISASMKVEADVFNFPIEWIPTRWNAAANYAEVWGEQYNFGMYYLNSIKIVLTTTVFQVLTAAMGAYAFTKVNFKFRDQLFLVYLATMMIPNQVTITSQFVIMQTLGLYNSHAGVILLGVFSVYGVFLLRQAMLSVPLSLSESAKIDGAGHFRIFWQIMLPILKPSLATLAILKFVWTWNDYQTPLIFLNTRELFTIPLGMKMFASTNGAYYSLIMAAAVSATLPLIIVFLLGQRYIIDGIATGAVKG